MFTMATIRQLREQKGWTQTDLAVRSGVSIVTISRVENGNGTNSSTLTHLSRALGVEVSEIEGVKIARRPKHA